MIRFDVFEGDVTDGVRLARLPWHCAWKPRPGATRKLDLLRLVPEDDAAVQLPAEHLASGRRRPAAAHAAGRCYVIGAQALRQPRARRHHDIDSTSPSGVIAGPERGRGHAVQRGLPNAAWI